MTKYKYTHEEEIQAICDAKQDILAGLNCMTDAQASPFDIQAMSIAYCKLHNAYMQGIPMVHALPKEEHTGVHRIAHEIMAILENPPVEWQNHLGTPNGLSDILQMEMGKTTQAHSDMKAGTGKHSTYMQRLRILAAVIMLNLETMTCDK